MDAWTAESSSQHPQVCQKSIALTYDFVISNRKPLRMVACDEAVFSPFCRES